mgnify:FL=1
MYKRQYLRRYRLASLEVLEAAGHYPMNETPLALAAAIETFLAALEERADARVPSAS